VSQGLVVAVDGPSGSGKSTVARQLAQRLSAAYLDTGAMYRAMTWLVLDRSLAPDDATAVLNLVRMANLEIGLDPAAPTVAVNGVNVAAAIRTPEVTKAVSAVSAIPAVRTLLVDRQRALIAEATAEGRIVVEGRDIGTVVVPQAPVKVFLTASVDERARRRAAETTGDQQATAVDLTRRDGLDSSRAASPLAQAGDAIMIDSTSLSVDDVVEAVLARCQGICGVMVNRT
jgi:cytidylate kinase